MFALLNDEELREAYGDYRESLGVDLVSDIVSHLVAGEAREDLLKAGISEEYISKAEQLITLIKS